MPVDFTPLEERVRSVEIAQARSETKIEGMAEDVAAIRKKIEDFGEVIERLGRAQAKTMAILVLCATLIGWLVPPIIGRFFGG